jgi:hypothetical protein
MQAVTDSVPELEQDERAIVSTRAFVSTRVCAAPRLAEFLAAKINTKGVVA